MQQCTIVFIYGLGMNDGLYDTLLLFLERKADLMRPRSYSWNERQIVCCLVAILQMTGRWDDVLLLLLESMADYMMHFSYSWSRRQII